MAPLDRRERSDTRRRFTASYAMSILLHVLLVLFFGVHLVTAIPAKTSDTVNETIAVQSQQLAVAKATAAPPLRPPPRATALPIVAPSAFVPTRKPANVVGAVVATNPRAASERPRRSRPRPSAAPKHELAADRPDGTPVATPLPAGPASLEPAATTAAVANSRVVARLAPAVPTAPSFTIATARPRPSVPTQPPTAPATAPPTQPPTAPPTQPPTAPPTQAPTASPTQAPTASQPPTAPPTRTPTAPPTRAPTTPPTRTPSAPPARVAVATTQTPELRPTAKPPRAATAAPATAVPTAAVTDGAASTTSAPAAASSPASGSTTTAAAGPSRVAAGTAGARTSTAGRRGAKASPGRSPASGGAHGAANGSTTTSGGARTARTSGTPGDALGKLNDRLKNMIATGGPEKYSDKEYQGSLDDAVAEVKAEYLHLAAPPEDVLAHAIATIYHRRTLVAPDTVMYVLKRRRIFGFEICTGWVVTLHPFGGGLPHGEYSFGSCDGEDFSKP